MSIPDKLDPTDTSPAKLKCPVCPYHDIDPDAEKCPQCNTDLRPLQRVRSLARRFYNDALRAHERGDAEAAIAAAEASLAVGPECPQALILLGKLRWARGECDAALDRWRRALALSPGDAKIAGLIAEARERMRRRSVRRTALWLSSVAGAILLLVGLTLVPASAARRREFRTREGFEGQLDSSRAGLAASARMFEAYRSRFTHSDSELAQLAARADSAAATLRSQIDSLVYRREVMAREQAEADRRLDEYSEVHRNIESVLRMLVREGSSSPTGPNLRLSQSLVELVAALRSPTADALLAEIERVRSDVDSLRVRQAKAGGSGLIVRLQRRSIAAAARQKEEVLDSLRRAYARDYLRFDRVLRALKEARGDSVTGQPSAASSGSYRPQSADPADRSPQAGER